MKGLFDFVSGKMENKEVGIIGTGDFARALAKRLTYSGYRVTCGSRNPQAKNLARIDSALTDVSVRSVSECIQTCKILFVAIPPEVHNTLKKYNVGLAGKILIDISNPTSEEDADAMEESLAENLARMLPAATVVKAFNTLSAYGLEVDASITNGNRDVMVAGDDIQARNTVMQLARDLGFTAMDHGGLKMSRELERIPVLLFNGWGLATKTVLTLFPAWFALGYARYYILKQPPFTLNLFPVNFLNKIFACMAVSLLASCFVPGCFAAFAQIRNGTKYARFSHWLDAWLRMRKQLGIYGLMFALMHVVMSVVIIQPAYFPTWFVSSSVQVQVPDGGGTVTVPMSSVMNLKGTFPVSEPAMLQPYTRQKAPHESVVFSFDNSHFGKDVFFKGNARCMLSLGRFVTQCVELCLFQESAWYCSGC